ncbi:hypothetical protein [Halosimplex pelagicum]|uniref:Uncharacterized protein n=1 Tax=Halosimplex pelagicum TaxID=869886 RepID=A0A7D5TBQ3_9EURY|nr:hypothetical protein [Halosimplex pelagicum]QLH82373.1 hypothetical protein HZS54_12425 [Halosimplex pelagicum]
MEHNLVDGRSAPSSGDSVRIRVLQDEDGNLGVDRPYRDLPLELSAGGEISFPEEPGTYEVRGTVSRVMLADRDGADYLFLDDHHVEKVADRLVELPREEDAPEWKETDASDADVDVDVDSVLPEDTIVEDADSRSTVGEAESLSESLNELLLGKK